MPEVRPFTSATIGSEQFHKVSMSLCGPAPKLRSMCPAVGRGAFMSRLDDEISAPVQKCLPSLRNKIDLHSPEACKSLMRPIKAIEVSASIALPRCGRLIVMVVNASFCVTINDSPCSFSVAESIGSNPHPMLRFGDRRSNWRQCIDTEFTY